MPARYPRTIAYVRHVSHGDVLAAVWRGNEPCDEGRYCHHNAHSMLFKTNEAEWLKGREAERASLPLHVTQGGSSMRVRSVTLDPTALGRAQVKEQRWVNPDDPQDVAGQIRAMAIRADSGDGVVRLSAQQAHEIAAHMENAIQEQGDWDEDYD